MDVERALLSKALASGELPDVIARGIEADHFADDELADIYEWSSDFMAKHKQPPSMEVVRGEFGSFSPLLTKDPLTYHLDRFVRLVKERMAVELVRGYHDMLEDPAEIDEIELHALEMARELNEVIPTPKAQRLSEGGARRQEYERRKKKRCGMASRSAFRRSMTSHLAFSPTSFSSTVARLVVARLRRSSTPPSTLTWLERRRYLSRLR